MHKKIKQLESFAHSFGCGRVLCFFTLNLSVRQTKFQIKLYHTIYLMHAVTVNHTDYFFCFRNFELESKQNLAYISTNWKKRNQPTMYHKWWVKIAWNQNQNQKQMDGENSPCSSCVWADWSFGKRISSFQRIAKILYGHQNAISRLSWLFNIVMFVLRSGHPLYSLFGLKIAAKPKIDR